MKSSPEQRAGRMGDRPGPVAQLPALTTLRFLAGCVVLLVHAHAVFGLEPWHIEIAGSHAVVFFFLLSGFILSHVYRNLDTWASCARFLISRLLRVYPVYLASLVLLFLLVPQVGRANLTSPLAFGAYLLLIQTWIPLPSYYYAGVGVAWCMSVELFFYFCFPFFLRHVRKAWPVLLMGTFTMVIGCIWLAARKMARTPNSDQVDIMLGYVKCLPLARLFEFTVGMSLYPLYQWLAEKKRPSVQVATLIEVLAVLILLLQVSGGSRLNHFLEQRLGLSISAGYWVWQSGICLPGLCLFTVVFALHRGWISRVLSHRAGVFLGELTYSLYLTHAVVLEWFKGNADGLITWSRSIAFVGYSSLALLTAYGMWRLVEQPARSLRLGTRFLTRKQTGGVPERAAA